MDGENAGDAKAGGLDLAVVDRLVDADDVDAEQALVGIDQGGCQACPYGGVVHGWIEHVIEAERDLGRFGKFQVEALVGHRHAR